MLKKTQVKISELNNCIHMIRGRQVMLDRDLAGLYSVATKRLNEAVKRNTNRFPQDFMVQLTQSEENSLRSQIATLKKGRGGHRKYLPFVFTEQGVAMLSSVLNSEIAIEVNIQIMRAFVQMRRFSLTTLDLKRKIDGMKQKYDTQFRVVFDALRQLISPPTKKRNTP